eukprot:s593_g11.t1
MGTLAAMKVLRLLPVMLSTALACLGGEHYHLEDCHARRTDVRVESILFMLLVAVFSSLVVFGLSWACGLWEMRRCPTLAVAALPFFFTVAICIVLPFPLIHSITLDVHHRDDARDCYLLANSELAFSVPAPERAELGNRAVRYLAVTTVLNTIGSSGQHLALAFRSLGTGFFVRVTCGTPVLADLLAISPVVLNPFTNVLMKRIVLRMSEIYAGREQTKFMRMTTYAELLIAIIAAVFVGLLDTYGTSSNFPLGTAHAVGIAAILALTVLLVLDGIFSWSAFTSLRAILRSVQMVMPTEESNKSIVSNSLAVAKANLWLVALAVLGTSIFYAMLIVLLGAVTIFYQHESERQESYTGYSGYTEPSDPTLVQGMVPLLIWGLDSIFNDLCAVYLGCGPTQAALQMVMKASEADAVGVPVAETPGVQVLGREHFKESLKVSPRLMPWLPQLLTVFRHVLRTAVGGAGSRSSEPLWATNAVSLPQEAPRFSVRSRQMVLGAARCLRHFAEASMETVAHQCRSCGEEFASKNSLHRHLREAHGAPQNGQQPAVRAPRELPPPMPLGVPIRMPEDRALPESLLRAFNAWARGSPPIFRVPSRVPSRVLRRDVPLKDLEDAWEKGRLWAISVGTRGTFLRQVHGDQSGWLKKAVENPEERDILLSPLQPEVNADLLVAILRGLNVATCHDVHRFARGTWNGQASAQRWQKCAEQAKGRVQIRYQGCKQGYLSPTLCLSGEPRVKQDIFCHEEFAFSFLQRVDGEVFQCLGSIAESMYHFAESCPVSVSTCYGMVTAAIESGNIKNMSSIAAESANSGSTRSEGARDSRLMVRLRGTSEHPAVCVSAMERLWKETNFAAKEGAHVHDLHRIRMVSLQDLSPTLASDAAARCQQKYGGSFARGICKDWTKGHCRFESQCRYVHLLSAPKIGCPLPDGLCEETCFIRDAGLREVLWQNMKKGILRTPLLQLLQQLRDGGENAEDTEIFGMLQREIQNESLVVLVAAPSAKAAHDWQQQIFQSLTSVVQDGSVCVLISPVLQKPPASLMECLMNYCQQELLQPCYPNLRKVCRSCFSLHVLSSGLTKLTKYVGYCYIKPGDTKNKSRWKVKAVPFTFQSKWKPSDNVEQRKRDMEGFLAASGASSEWPSVGVLLESARLLGPASLQAKPGRRSRLGALFWLLESIEGTMGLEGSTCDENEHGEQEEWESEEEEQVFLEMESLASQAPVQTRDPWPVAEDLEMHVWPWHVENYSVEDTVSWCCRKAVSREPLGALQGKRVIRMTSGQHLLSVFVSNLVYGLELADGSVAPERMQSLLQSVGAAPALYSAVLQPDQSGTSSDLFIAVMVACFCRQLAKSCDSESLSHGEVLGGLLIAKALCRGQGRCHQLRRSIIGFLRRHPALCGRLDTVCRGGSVAMGLDTTHSDHDIFLCLKNGAEDMVEELHGAILDLKRTSGRFRFHRAEVVKKDFAVEIKNYYRQRDFDLVPVTFRQGHVGEQQWDPQRGVWQALLHPRLAPKLQLLSEQHPNAFFAMRLVKMWNESLDLRQGKPPMVTLHIPLLTLGAWEAGRLEGSAGVQVYFLRILKYVRESWLRDNVVGHEKILRELDAGPHLRRMIAKYDETMRQRFPEELDRSIQWLELACISEPKASSAALVDGASRLFGCRQLLSRNPSSGSRDLSK